MLKVYFRTYTTHDGWIAIACGSHGLRQRFIRAIGLEDPGLESDELARSEPHYEELRQTAERTMAEKTTAEWEKLLGDAGLRYAAVRDYLEVARDEGVYANGYLQRVEHPEYGELPMPGGRFCAFHGCPR